MRETAEKKFGFGSGVKTIHLQFLDRPIDHGPWLIIFAVIKYDPESVTLSY